MLLYIEKPIFNIGMNFIIRENFAGSTIINVHNKGEIMEVLESNKIRCAIIEIRHTNKGDFSLIKGIKERYPNLIILIVGTRNIGIRTLKFIKLESLGLLLDIYSEDEIVDELRYRISLKNSTKTGVRKQNEKHAKEGKGIFLEENVE